uniref:HAUS augmin like complex subunit 7 n=1 Tax=Kryptolebias marmoratus TaxID=37003 RepID=A0A3Q2ZSR6_KRYMA
RTAGRSGGAGASSCPLVEGLYLQEDDSMLELLCSPSELRTDILTWICCSINPNFVSSKDASVKSKDPDALTKEIAAFGQELMLSKMNDLDLIKGKASPLRQLRFLEQLLTLVPGCKKSAGNRTDGEALLNELFAAENLQNLTHMLRPSLDPWPAQIKYVFCLYGRLKRFLDILETSTKFKYLLNVSPQCDFLKDGAALSVFSPSSLRLSACDLQQLMTTFSHVFDTDMKPYCSREPPSFSADTDIFQRVHQRLLACNTVLKHNVKNSTQASRWQRAQTVARILGFKWRSGCWSFNGTN